MLSADTLPRRAWGVPAQDDRAAYRELRRRRSAEQQHRGHGVERTAALRHDDDRDQPDRYGHYQQPPLRATSPAVARPMVPTAAPAPKADMSKPSPAGPMSNSSAA